MLPPASRIGPITTEERNAVIAASSVKGTYETTIDRESAYEKLKGRATTSADAATAGAASGGIWDSVKGSLGGLMTGTGRKDSLVEAMAKAPRARSARLWVAKSCAAILGSLLGRRR